MKKGNKNINTPYDDVFRTLLTDCSELIIPVVNEVFQKDYDIREKVILSQNELFMNRQDGEQQERITDSHFILGDARYHIECQSTEDGTMMIRVFEYDSQIALQDGEWDDYHLTVNFPNTAVMYLRHTKNTPDYVVITLNVPNGSLDYKVPALKVQKYSIEEIFEKKLFFLIPFHIFCYEKDFRKYEADETRLQELTQIYGKMMEELNECQKKGTITEFEKFTVVDLARKVLEQLARKYSNVKKGVSDIMGGKVINHLAKDILNQGKAEGLKEGKKDDIISFLVKKGVPSDKLREYILKEQNLDTLKEWLMLAAEAETVEQFEAMIMK